MDTPKEGCGVWKGSPKELGLGRSTGLRVQEEERGLTQPSKTIPIHPPPTFRSVSGEAVLVLKRQESFPELGYRTFSLLGEQAPGDGYRLKRACDPFPPHYLLENWGLLGRLSP